MNELEISSEKVDGALVVRLVGDPQIMSGEPLEKLVNDTVAANPDKVVIDLTRLGFISSLLAGKLVAMQTFLKRNGGRAVIAGPSADVKDALTRMRVVTLIPVVDTVEAAMAN